MRVTRDLFSMGLLPKKDMEAFIDSVIRMAEINLQMIFKLKGLHYKKEDEIPPDILGGGV